MHWAYQDSATGVGPQKWGTLSGDELCSLGKNQTPIDISSSVPISKEMREIQFHYVSSPLKLTNNGHSVQVTPAMGSNIVLEGNSFRLLQFHFHAKSEHSIDGKFSPLEIHFVHADSNGKPAVVIAVLVREGKHSSALDAVFSHLPRQTDHTIETAGTVDPSIFLPSVRGYFAYNGSLTTPPCSEGIKWLVLKNSIEMDQAQISSFTKISGFDHTSRPPQPIGTRQLEQTSF
jgi:carbonic anhydrase